MVKAESQNDAAVRRELTHVVLSPPGWNGSEVIEQCRYCRLDELDAFVEVLRYGSRRIPLRFRWAADADIGPLFTISSGQRNSGL